MPFSPLPFPPCFASCPLGHPALTPLPFVGNGGRGGGLQRGHARRADSSPRELGSESWPESWKAHIPSVRSLPPGSILGSLSCPGLLGWLQAGLPVGSLHGCFWPQKGTLPPPETHGGDRETFRVVDRGAQSIKGVPLSHTPRLYCRSYTTSQAHS